MKLSVLERSQAFLDSINHAPDQAARVEAVRQIALLTPPVICRMLRDMGCLLPDSDFVHVVVKEGTRAIDGGIDWKISFHFVFQIFITLAQFRCLYEMLIQHMAASGCSNPHLAFLLDLLSVKEYESRCTPSGSGGMPLSTFAEEDGGTDARRTRALDSLLGAACPASSSGTALSPDVRKASALVGMDLHPRQNAYQGLACLGSRKKSGDSGNRLVGMMRVPSAMAGKDSAPAFEWLDGYALRTHPLLVLTESSVIMPGPRCLGLSCMDGWSCGGRQQPGASSCMEGVVTRAEGVNGCRADGAAGESGQGVFTRAEGVKDGAAGESGQCERMVDSSLADALARVSRTEMEAVRSLFSSLPRSRAGAGVGVSRGKVPQRGLLARGASPSSLSSSSLCGTVPSGSMKDAMDSVPRWFRACVGAMYEGENYEMAFRTGNLNIQHISKPCIIPKQHEHGCRTIHVSRTEICMCTLSMLEVPFKVRFLISVLLCTHPFFGMTRHQTQRYIFQSICCIRNPLTAALGRVTSAIRATAWFSAFSTDGCLRAAWITSAGEFFLSI
jgi:hypothetical protein